MGEEIQGQYHSLPFYAVSFKIRSCLMVVSCPGFCYPINNVWSMALFFWNIPTFAGINRISQEEKIHKKSGPGSSLPSLCFSDSGGTDFAGLSPELALSQPSPPTLNFKYTGGPLPVQQSSSEQIKN